MNDWHLEIGEWVTYLRATGAPTTTLTVRRHHVQQAAKDLPVGPWEVTLTHLVEWFAERTWAPNTRRSYRTTLRAFYGWGMATGRTTTSPAHLLPPVRVPRAKARPTPEPAYREALAKADDRVALAIRLAGACGMRRGEIARTRREHVEATPSGLFELRVIGKGGHERMVPLPPDLAATLLSRPPGWIFPSPRGGHLTPHHLAKVISRNLPEGLTTHTLRHRCATIAYAERKDLRAVQELLGHAKPETTAIYTQVPDDDVRAAMMAAAA